MAKVLQLRPGSDEFEAATCGIVRAERINDVVAAPDTKKHREYFRLIARQYQGEPETDPNDEYRHDEGRIAMIGKVLRLYREKHGVHVKGGLIYFHDDVQVCSCPHGVDRGSLGAIDTILLTVSVKASAETFERSVDRGVMPDRFKVAQAQMAVTGMVYAVLIDCFEDDTGAMEIYEHEVKYDKIRADQLLAAMSDFAERTREAAAA